MKKKIILNLSVFVLFLASLIIAKWTGFNAIKFLPGVLLLYYLPGNNFNDIFFARTKEPISWNLKLSIDIVSSFVIVYLFYNLFKSNLDYVETNSYVFILALNIFLFVSNLLLTKFKKHNPFESFSLARSKFLIIAAAIPILLYLIRLYLNPYIHEIDSRQYFDVYNNILKKGYDESWLIGQRNGFALSMIYSNYIAGINFIGFFKYFIPFFFYVTSITLFDFTREIRNKLISAMTYLLIIASPFLIVMNEGVRPETFIFIFTFPIFALTYYAIIRNNLYYYTIAFIYSYVSFRYHEFGVFLILLSIITGAVLLLKNRRSIINFIKNNPALSIVISIPYLVLARSFSSLFDSALTAQIFEQSKTEISNLLSNFQWKWWFLNSFTSIDGGTIEWPGWRAIIYYGYNGLNLISVFVLLLVMFFVLRRRTTLIKNRTFWGLFPVIAFLAIYLVIAELLPRIGLFIFPNRTWPHIMLALAFISPFLVLKLESINSKLISSKVMIGFFMAVLLSGAVATMFVSVFMGGQVLPGDKGVIKAIRNLPKESLVITTQLNENLVEIYGNKEYREINKSKYSSEEEFLKTAEAEIVNLPLIFENKLFDSYKVNRTQNLNINLSGLTKYITEDTVPITDRAEKIALIKKYDPVEFSRIEAQAQKYRELGDKPTYFVYSFGKFKGVLAYRNWWIDDNNMENLEFFKNYSGSEVVFKDDHAILIKIK